MKAQPFGNEIMVTNAFPLCRNMNVCTLKLKKSFKGESLTFVGFYTTDFRPVSVQEKLFCFFCEPFMSSSGHRGANIISSS